MSGFTGQVDSQIGVALGGDVGQSHTGEYVGRFANLLGSLAQKSNNAKAAQNTAASEADAADVNIQIANTKQDLLAKNSATMAAALATKDIGKIALARDQGRMSLVDAEARTQLLINTHYSKMVEIGQGAHFTETLDKMTGGHMKDIGGFLDSVTPFQTQADEQVKQMNDFLVSKQIAVTGDRTLDAKNYYDQLSRSRAAYQSAETVSMNKDDATNWVHDNGSQIISDGAAKFSTLREAMLKEQDPAKRQEMYQRALAIQDFRSFAPAALPNANGLLQKDTDSGGRLSEGWNAMAKPNLEALKEIMTSGALTTATQNELAVYTTQDKLQLRQTLLDVDVPTERVSTLFAGIDSHNPEAINEVNGILDAFKNSNVVNNAKGLAKAAIFLENGLAVDKKELNPQAITMFKSLYKSTENCLSGTSDPKSCQIALDTVANNPRAFGPEILNNGQEAQDLRDGISKVTSKTIAAADQVVSKYFGMSQKRASDFFDIMPNGKNDVVIVPHAGMKVPPEISDITNPSNPGNRQLRSAIRAEATISGKTTEEVINDPYFMSRWKAVAPGVETKSAPSATPTSTHSAPGKAPPESSPAGPQDNRFVSAAAMADTPSAGYTDTPTATKTAEPSAKLKKLQDLFAKLPPDEQDFLLQSITPED